MKTLLKTLILLILILLLTNHSAVFGQSAYTVSGSRPINARDCPRLNCNVVTTFNPGDVLQVMETVDGDAVAGSTSWHQVTFNEQDVYVHSSLVTASGNSNKADSADTKQNEAPQTTVSSDNWEVYHATGMSIQAPPEWLNFSGDEDFARMMARYDENGMAMDISVTRYVNGFVLVDSRSGTGLQVTAFYDGWDTPLSILQMNITDYLRDQELEIIEASIVTIAGERALRTHYRSTDDILAIENVEYLQFRDRVMYCLNFYNVNGLSDDDLAMIESIAASFSITSPTEMRHALSAHMGVAKEGNNVAEFEIGWGHIWQYEGKQGEKLTVQVRPEDEDSQLDTYLIIRTPDGEIIGESDDYYGVNPYLKGLTLPIDGTYEIEVHCYREFTSGNYKLSIGENGNNSL